MPIVTAPNSEFTGVRAGVKFVDGKGEVKAFDKSALAYFDRHGYQVGGAGDERPAKSATKKDWVAHAVSRGASREAAESYTRDELAGMDSFDGLEPKA